MARPLDEIYSIVWLDGTVIRVHQDYQELKKTIHLALGVNWEGCKELLGIWIAEHEGKKFWGRCLRNLTTAEYKDACIFCMDGLRLKGFPEAIEGVFPKSDIQLCVVHLVRNSLRYVGCGDAKEG